MEKLNLKTVENFLTVHECKEVIDYCIPFMNNSSILDYDNIESNDLFRKSYDTWINKDIDIPIFNKIRNGIAKYSGLPESNQESLSVIQYPVGGIFKDHYDYLHPNTSYYETECNPRGGQRIKTCMIYLNDDFVGGNTEFTTIDVSITPKTGKLICWNNADEHLDLIDESKHRGNVVEAGNKWILVAWIRANTFIL